MDFRRFATILAVLLLTVLIIQPVLSADNVTKTVTNQTSDLERDIATGYYNNGERSIVNGDYDTAIKLFDQALASNTTMLKKTDALLYLYRDKAYSQIQLKKYNDAVTTLDEGLALYPTDAMLWNNKGYALSLLGKTQDALASYDKSVSFDRNYTNAYLNRGNLLSELGRYTEAAAAYTRANETDPFNIAASDGLAAAKKGEAGSTRTMTILLVIVLVAAIGIVVWYVKFRKPSEPAPEEKKTKSKKK
jgi:tetratricopeptide (TPR) repeat protein